jgi:hypothetical protein
MVQLNDEQVDKVLRAILEQYDDRSIAEELLDHFCCFIEEQLTKDVSFEDGLKEAFEAIAPNGVKEIKDELILMLHLKTQTTMKRIFYISVFITTFSLMFSLLSRHWHWDAGTVVTQLIGNLALIFLVLPSITVMAFRNIKLLSFGDIFRMIAGILSGMAIATGLIFKTLYFPYANVLFTSGMLVMMFIFLPIFFWQLYKRSFI